MAPRRSSVYKAAGFFRPLPVSMRPHLWLVVAAAVFTLSCTRHAQTERWMTWSEETQFMGMALPAGEKVIVLRFVDDPGQGRIEDWSLTFSSG